MGQAIVSVQPLNKAYQNKQDPLFLYNLRQSLDINLVHHWPLRSNGIDIISSCNFEMNERSFSSENKNNEPFSAIDLRNNIFYYSSNNPFPYESFPNGPNGRDFTIAFWIKPYVFKKSQILENFKISTGCCGGNLTSIAVLYIDKNGELQVAIDDWDSEKRQRFSSEKLLDLNRWSFVTIVYRDAVIFFYINEIQTCEGRGITGYLDIFSKDMRIGGFYDTYDKYGTSSNKINSWKTIAIHDFMIFNKALDFYEIKSLI